MKNLCETHRVYYRGEKCPYCEQERIEKLSKTFVKEKKTVKEDREIDENDIARLIEKFNVR